MNYKPETMKIVEQKTARQWMDDWLACLLNYTVVGGTEVCPDTFVVNVSGKNMPASRNTLHRKPGEADYDFWDRTLDVASRLTSKAQTKQFTPYRRDYTIEIQCCYDHNNSTAYSDGRKNFERLLWSVANNDPNDEFRVYALGLLAQMYGMYEAS